jgi:hypothetical protein
MISEDILVERQCDQAASEVLIKREIRGKSIGEDWSRPGYAGEGWLHVLFVEAPDIFDASPHPDAGMPLVPFTKVDSGIITAHARESVQPRAGEG